MGFDPAQMELENITKVPIGDLHNWLDEGHTNSQQRRVATREIARRHKEDGRKLYRITWSTFIAAVLGVLGGDRLAVSVRLTGFSKDDRPITDLLKKRPKSSQTLSLSSRAFHTTSCPGTDRARAA